MGKRLQRLQIPTLFIFIILGAVITACQQNLEWIEADEYRYAALEVEGSGSGFEEVASEAGIDFTNLITDEEIVINRNLMHGSGVALGDVDGDGWVDIYFSRLNGSNVLYRNLGNWKFEDITDKAGVANDNQYSTGAVFADVDGDEDLDLLVASYKTALKVYMNDGSGAFPEVNELHRNRGTTSLALADYDLDGDLDLYATNYKYKSLNDSLPPQVIAWEKVIKEIGPGKYEVYPEFRNDYTVEVRGTKILKLERGEPDVFYTNDGNGGFVTSTLADELFRNSDGVPLDSIPRDWGLSTQFRDFNGDGLADIYVCNDFEGPDHIWVNKGGYFEASAPTSFRHTSNASMSVDFSDLNSDGYPEIFVSDMLSQSHALRKMQMGNMIPTNSSIGVIDNRPQYMRNTLFLNRGDNTFGEIAQYSGVQASEWSWSANFMDVDLDGHNDLLVTTGHLYDVQDSDTNAEEIKRIKHASSFKEYRSLLFMYPKLDLNNVAFRNLGNLKFESVENGWGIGMEKDVSHGMAAADLDNDGDLDVVINRLNKPAGVYRNTSEAPRVAIRLSNTKSKNTNAVGAKIEITGGPVEQHKDVYAGGHFLSGSDYLQTFATGSAKSLTARIIWPDGSESIVDGLLPNHAYQFDQAMLKAEAGMINASNEGEDVLTTAKTYFEDISEELGHTHHDDPFDDFSLQSLLPNRLSQYGPSMAFSDHNNDNIPDLTISSGKGGSPELFIGHGEGKFRNKGLMAKSPMDQTSVLALQSGTLTEYMYAYSNYESADATNSYVKVGDQKVDLGNGFTGSMSQADVDGDGDLDVFVSGRGVKGRYPEPTDSYILKNESGKWTLDNQPDLQSVGMVTSSVFSDIDNDNDPDLVLGLEWGPVKVLVNDAGVFTDRTVEFGLNEISGWWNGVNTGDFNGDGQMDIIATNWGENTKYHLSTEPLKIFYNDFDRNGVLDIIEAHYDNEFGELVPERGFSCISNAMPFVKDDKQTYENYANSSLSEVFGQDLAESPFLQANTLASTVFINKGGVFEPVQLPMQVNLTTAMQPVVADFNADGIEDLFISQNFFAVQIETDRNDSGRGALLLGKGNGEFEWITGAESGLLIYGEQRAAAIADVNNDGKSDLAVTQNGAETKLYKNSFSKRGVKVHLVGKNGNVNAVGARLRIEYESGDLGATREIKLGAGRGSQDSPVQILGLTSVPVALHVVWPDGKESKYDLTSDKMDYVFRYN